VEIMLQWLDDLEDLVFGVALAWERLHHVLLQLGLLAALLLAATQLRPLGFAKPELLAGIAFASVVAWLLGSLLARRPAYRSALKNMDPSLT
jgi:hypothetical protein